MDNERRFVFYGSFKDALQHYPEADRLHFYEQLINYGLDGEIPDFSDFRDEALFEQMRVSIDAAKIRHFNAVNRGKMGGAPKNNNNAGKQNKLKQPKTSKNNLNSNTNSNINSNNNITTSSNKGESTGETLSGVRRVLSQKHYKNLDGQPYTVTEYEDGEKVVTLDADGD